jgi:peptidoglycan/LPS O-acetylase OafA/YrhL
VPDADRAPTIGGPNLRHNNFDLLRLFAASQVAYWHVAINLDVELDGVFAVIGDALLLFPGVPIFFVISGFLISASFDRNPNVREYVLNRFLRIYPGLWTATIVTLGILVLFGDRVWAALAAAGESPWRPVAAWLGAQFTFAQFYNPHELKANYGAGHLNGSLWTIPIELQFYVVLPFLAAFLWRNLTPRQQNVLLVCAVALAYGVTLLFRRHIGDVRAADPDVARLVIVGLPPYLYMFLLGILLQRNHVALERFIVGKGVLWLAAYVAAATASARLLGTSVATATPPLFLMTLLALATVSLAFTRPGLSAGLLRGNDISYGTYVYHMIIANLAVELGYTGTRGAHLAVLAATYVAAVSSWVLVERPALGLKRHPLFARARAGAVRATRSTEFPGRS